MGSGGWIAVEIPSQFISIVTGHSEP